MDEIRYIITHQRLATEQGDFGCESLTKYIIQSRVFARAPILVTDSGLESDQGGADNGDDGGEEGSIAGGNEGGDVPRSTSAEVEEYIALHDS
jgi:hypothetical protein